MKSKEQLFTELRQMMVETMNMPAEAITLEADIFKDLEFDSLDIVDTLIGIEKIVGRRIEDNVIVGVHTISDAINVMHGLQRPKAA